MDHNIIIPLKSYPSVKEFQKARTINCQVVDTKLKKIEII